MNNKYTFQIPHRNIEYTVYFLSVSHSFQDHNFVFVNFHVSQKKKLFLKNFSNESQKKSKKMKKVACVAALASVANAKTYFSENFDDASWEDRWVTTEVRNAFRKHV